jgi:hypothetical protein
MNPPCNNNDRRDRKEEKQGYESDPWTVQHFCRDQFECTNDAQDNVAAEHEKKEIQQKWECEISEDENGTRAIGEG